MKNFVKKSIVCGVSICMVGALLTGCGDSSDSSDTTAQSSAAETVDTSEGAEYAYVTTAGEYATLDKDSIADETSEEIAELAGGVHYIDETFDATQYASTINDAHEGTWGIYIYMCGSNLESEGGAATSDIQEMLGASLPEGSNIVIEAGGSTAWNNEMIDPSVLNRLVYDGTDINVVETPELADMGAESTLEDFLNFCNTNYPADNQMVIFWDHGGGSLGGACYDEIYDNDHLTLNEMDTAFTNVFGDQLIDTIGYDCCLMATVDTANMARKHAKMLVASEETEPGNGWYYTDWLNALTENPEMTGAELGTAICDSFQAGCEAVGTQDSITLSTIDLTQVNLVVDAINSASVELFQSAMEDASVLTTYGRNAEKSENYGGNTDESGYFDMVDIGDLISKSADILPNNSSYITDALSRAVVYSIHGDLRSQATGLAMFYPYDKTESNMQKYESVAASDLYAGLMRVTAGGVLSDTVSNLISLYAEANDTTADTVTQEACADTTEALTFTNDGEDLPLTISDDGYITASIGDNINAVQSVLADLLVYVEDADTFIDLGIDNDVYIDWETGDIQDDFRGVWPCLDGHYLNMNIICEEDTYNLYQVPVLINGEAKYLMVSYDYDAEAYSVLGYADAAEDTSNLCAAKGYDQLEKGDKITTIFSYYDSEEEDWVDYEMETFKYKPSMEITEEDLGDGQYAIMFDIQDTVGNNVYSDYGFIDYTDGEISTYLDEE